MSRKIVRFWVGRASFVWLGSVSIEGGPAVEVFSMPSRGGVIDLAVEVAGLLGVPPTTCAEARALLEVDRAAERVSLAFR